MCGIAGEITGLEGPLEFGHSIIYRICEFSFFYLMLFCWRDDAEMDSSRRTHHHPIRLNDGKYLWGSSVRASAYQGFPRETRGGVGSRSLRRLFLYEEERYIGARRTCMDTIRSEI